MERLFTGYREWIDGLAAFFAAPFPGVENIFLDQTAASIL